MLFGDGAGAVVLEAQPTHGTREDRGILFSRIRSDGRYEDLLYVDGGPGSTIRCEYNQRPYGRGALGMALSGKDTGGSQFFITLEPQPHLDGAYTQFGQVLSGMDVVEKIRPGDVIDRIDVFDGREAR